MQDQTKPDPDDQRGSNCADLDNCPACRFELQFDNPADFKLAIQVMGDLAALLGVPPIPGLRQALVQAAIRRYLIRNQMPASPDVAAAQAAARESGGQS